MKELTKDQKDLIVHYYVDEIMGQVAVSKKVLGVNNPDKIKKVLKEYGIHIRTQQESAILSNKKRASKKDETYFSTENANMAWLMGFIASDGSIRKNENEIKIGLAIKDKEILKKIKEELKLETEVKEYTNSQGYECCKLQWTCEQHKKDLAKYNIVPAKTFVLKPPYKLDKKYYIDYIRGYFDGDGSVNYIASNNSLRWQICSATKEILEFILDFFEKEFEIPKVKIQEKKSLHTIYYFQYSTSATKKIYSILYTPNSLYLKRKKDYFDTLMALK